MEFLIPVYRVNNEDSQSRAGALLLTGGKGVKLIDSDYNTIAYGIIDVESKMENLDTAIIAANEFRPILCEGYNPVQGEIEDYWGSPYIVVKAHVIGNNLYRIGNKDFIIIFTSDNHACINLIEEVKPFDHMVVASDVGYVAPITGVGFMSSPVTVDVGYKGTRINEDQNPTITKEKTFMNFNAQNIFKDVKFGKAPSAFELSFDNHIAYKGRYFDEKTNTLNDAMGLTLDIDGLLYIMPVQTIAKGDIVVRADSAFYFDGTNYIDLSTGSKGEYVPVRVLGMTFYSVVKNLAGNMFNSNGNNQMNNMLPFLLLDRDNDNDDLIKFMLLSQGGFNLFGQAPAPSANC